jgi:hypothetical protein
MLQVIDRQTITRPTLKRGRLADPELLREIAAAMSARQGAAAEDLMQLFSTVLHDIRIGGAWKRTNSGRLRQTEDMVSKYLPPHGNERLGILDLGASDGVTTVELVRAIRRVRGDAVSAYLTDLNLWLHRYRVGGLVEYRAADGEPILARIGHIGLRLARQRREREAERDLLARCYLGLRWLRRAMRLDARISLVSPLVAGEPGVTVEELNCLERRGDLVGKFAAVRASNILNLGYFSSAQIAEAVGHMHAYLREEGCLVVSKNVDQLSGEVENGSVWLKCNDRLQWMEDFGSGSEVKAIVDSWRAIQ